MTISKKIVKGSKVPISKLKIIIDHVDSGQDFSYSALGKELGLCHTTVSRVCARYRKNPNVFTELHKYTLKDLCYIEKRGCEPPKVTKVTSSFNVQSYHVNRFFREWFDSQDLSYPKAGELLGVNHTTVMRIYKGQYVPNLETASKFADNINLPLGYLWNVRELKHTTKTRTSGMWVDIIKKAVVDHEELLRNRNSSRIKHLVSLMKEMNIKFDPTRFLED